MQSKDTWEIIPPVVVGVRLVTDENNSESQILTTFTSVPTTCTLVPDPIPDELNQNDKIRLEENFEKKIFPLEGKLNSNQEAHFINDDSNNENEAILKAFKNGLSSGGFRQETLRFYLVDESSLAGKNKAVKNQLERLLSSGYKSSEPKLLLKIVLNDILMQEIPITRDGLVGSLKNTVTRNTITIGRKRRVEIDRGNYYLVPNDVALGAVGDSKLGQIALAFNNYSRLWDDAKCELLNVGNSHFKKGLMFVEGQEEVTYKLGEVISLNSDLGVYNISLFMREFTSPEVEGLETNLCNW